MSHLAFCLSDLPLDMFFGLPVGVEGYGNDGYGKWRNNAVGALYANAICGYSQNLRCNQNGNTRTH